MHVQHNVPDPVHPPAPQPQVPLEDAPVNTHMQSIGDAMVVFTLMG